MNHKEIINNFETGDILLFGSNQTLLSRLIRWWCHSKWSHVGFVLKDPVYIDPALKGLYLLESSYENTHDAIDHINKYGVQIVPLEDILEEYKGYIYWRKLEHSENNSLLHRNITMIFDNIKNKPYDLSLYDLFSLKMNISYPSIRYNYPILNWFLYDHKKLDSFICSGLVAYIYTELGFLSSNTRWSECMPKYFSEENTNLNLLNCKLNKEIKIK